MGDEDPIPTPDSLNTAPQKPRGEDPVMGLFEILKSARGKNVHKVPEVASHTSPLKPPALFWKIVLFFSAVATAAGWFLQSRARLRLPIEPLHAVESHPSFSATPQPTPSVAVGRGAPETLVAPIAPPPTRPSLAPAPTNRAAPTYEMGLHEHLEHGGGGRGPADFGGRTDFEGPEPIQEPPPLPAESVPEIPPEIPDTQFD